MPKTAPADALPAGVAGQKLLAERERAQRDRARKGGHVYHDPWGAQVPAAKRRRNCNLAEWLAGKRQSGEAV
jgi:hypothetical protein